MIYGIFWRSRLGRHFNAFGPSVPDQSIEELRGEMISFDGRC